MGHMTRHLIDTARLDERSRIPLPKLVKESLDLEPKSKTNPGSLVGFYEGEDGKIYVEKMP